MALRRQVPWHPRGTACVAFLDTVVGRAEDVPAAFEYENQNGAVTRLTDDFAPLPGKSRQYQGPTGPSALEAALAALVSR